MVELSTPLLAEQDGDGSTRSRQSQQPTFDKGAVEAYAEECRRLSVPADLSVAAWLRFGGDSLQISGAVPYEGCLLPVYDFVARSSSLKRLSLHVPSAYRHRSTGNSNARILRHLLAVNTSLEELNLQASGLDHVGMADLAEGLRQNHTLRTLNLRGNFLGSEGGEVLVDLVTSTLEKGKTGLRFIDASYSSIGFDAARQIMRLTGRSAVDSRVKPKATDDVVSVEVAGNFETEELWNAVTHGLMFLLSILGSVLLLGKVVNGPVHHIWGCVLFCFGLLFMFLSSTLYHSLFLYPCTTRVFQVLDHCGIFTLIAATYSPFMLFYNKQSHMNLLKAEWILCGLGVVVHLVSQYAHWGTSRLYLTSELMLYLVMGWGVMIVWPSLSQLLPSYSLNTLVAGGLFYTAGVPFFIMADYRPICHTVWHVFVAGGAICHWFSVESAAVDAVEHHAEGPFIPEIQRWQETFSLVKDELSKFQHEAKDHGLMRTLRSVQSRLDSQAILLSGLAGAWGNFSFMDRLGPALGLNHTDGAMHIPALQQQLLGMKP